MKSTQKSDNMEQIRLPKIWAEAKKNYTLLKKVGEGTFGIVVKAQHKTTGDIVAIKLIQSFSKNSFQTRSLLRELVILRKLQNIEGNMFTTEMRDIILPPEVILQRKEKNEEEVDVSNDLQQRRTSEVEPEDVEQDVKQKTVIDCQKLDHIFIVMEYVDCDLTNILKNAGKIEFDEDHVITILYNILCAVNVIHSANIIHRDIKPANILLDDDCGVKICDFGLSRCLPAKTDLDRNIEKYQKKQWKQDQQDSEDNHELRENRFKSQTSYLLKQSEEERKVRERQLSTCIQTRWYRAPEVILLDHNYNKAIDIWSVGMILSELLYCTKKYSSKPNFDSSNRYLFDGAACYPISPQKEGTDDVCEDDQILKILKRFPNLESQDLAHLTTDESKNYINQLNNFGERQNISDLYPETNPDLVAIMKQMLEFNPYFRPSAKQLLKNKIFNSVRIKSNEVQATHSVVINVDKHPTMAIDYNETKVNTTLEPEKIRKLKQMIILESLKFNSTNKD